MDADHRRVIDQALFPLVLPLRLFLPAQSNSGGDSDRETGAPKDFYWRSRVRGEAGGVGVGGRRNVSG